MLEFSVVRTTTGVLGKDSTNERDAFDFYTGYVFLVRGLG